MVRTVSGRFHLSDEEYFGAASEIVPLKHKKGQCTYIMMQPYVLEPIITISARLVANPKKYADQEPAIGHTVGQPKTEGFREVQLGNAQAWYYPVDRVIVLWECFFDDRFRRHPLVEDQNMQQLWSAFESWMVTRVPAVETIATPASDPIAESTEDYQVFLRKSGYSPVSTGAYAKRITTIWH
jgi:hypothetical protein